MSFGGAEPFELSGGRRAELSAAVSTPDCDPCAGAKLCRGLGLSWLGTLGFYSSGTTQKRKTTKPSASCSAGNVIELLISLLSLSAVFACIRNGCIKVFT